SAIAGVNLAALRGSPLYAKLPKTFGGARYVLIAARGAEVVTVSDCANPPRHAPSPLLVRAEGLAAHNAVWAVIRGGVPLPLEGNLANFNTLLSDAAMVTAAANVTDRIAIELTAECASPGAARHFEGSLRALLLLGKAASEVQLRHDGSTVHA